MTKHIYTAEQSVFDLSHEIHKLLTCFEMQKSLAKPGSKQAWLWYLQRGDTSYLDADDVNDRLVMDKIIALLTTYAFLVAQERFAADKNVQTYMHLMEKMAQGHELHDEMILAIERLPESFKDAVRLASQQAQEYLLQCMLEEYDPDTLA